MTLKDYLAAKGWQMNEQELREAEEVLFGFFKILYKESKEDEK